MSSIIWKHCVGQRHVKENFNAAIANNTLGHAYLFCGIEGSGKFAAALDIGLALLCEAKKDRPCMTCASCQKALHYAHPDFRVIMPVTLAKEHKKSNELSEQGWTYISGCVNDRMANPYALPDHEKIPDIPVDLVRETMHAVRRGPVEAGVSVTVIDGVDTMKKESANAMLKLLEEPPAGTVFLLLTSRISGVLPTIVSRCHVLRFGLLSPDEIRTELEKRPVTAPSGKGLESVLHTGSLGMSLRLCNNPSEETVHAAAHFWDLCASGNWPEIAGFIDRIVAWEDVAMHERLLMEFMQRIRNSLLHEIQGSENVFLDGDSERLFELCQRSVSAIRARGNMHLILANFAIGLTEALYEQKQQRS